MLDVRGKEIKVSKPVAFVFRSGEIAFGTIYRVGEEGHNYVVVEEDSNLGLYTRNRTEILMLET